MNAKLHSNLLERRGLRFNEDILPCSWPLFAAGSFLTSRHILVRINWHFPIHLLVGQLLVLSLFKLFDASRRRGASAAAGDGDRGRPSGSRLAQVMTADFLSPVISLPLIAQAILHLNNVPTSATLGLLAFVPPLIAAVLLPSSSGVRTRHVRRLLIAIAALTLVLLYEYRLTVNGLVFAILGTGVYGLLRALSLYLQAGCIRISTGLDGVKSTMTATISIAVIAFCFEDTPAALASFLGFSLSETLLLLVNLLLTAAAFSVGHSIVSPHFESSQVVPVGLQKGMTVWTVLCSAALVTLGTMYRHMTIVNTVQIFAAPIAAFALMDVNLGGITKELRENIGRPRRNLDALLSLTPLNQQKSSLSIRLLLPDDDDSSDDEVESATHLLRPETAQSTTFDSRPISLMLILTIICGICSMYLASTDRGPQPTTSRAPLLDIDYLPKTNLDVVISMYAEPLHKLTATLDLLLSIPAVRYQSTRLFIYSKNYQADLNAIAQAVPRAFKDPKIAIRENIGRESETYLAHILSHWDTLANHTIFLQAETHNPRELLPRIRDYYVPETGMLPLGFSGYTCPCGSSTCGDRFWSDASGVVRETHLLASNRNPAEPTACAPEERILLSYKGQFIASAARIRGVGAAHYERLQKWLVEPDSWVHRPGYLRGKEDDLSKPVFGYTVERMWSALLQCADEDIAVYCPSLLSGWRSGGSRRDCQCLDI